MVAKERSLDERPGNYAMLVTSGILVTLLVVYVVGYFALSVNHSGPIPNSRCRVFKSHWLVTIYKPAAKCESAATGDRVATYWIPDQSP